jgi:hypothetical protein
MRQKPIFRSKSGRPQSSKKASATDMVPTPTTPVARQAMLSFFDYTTVMAKPWARAGYLCYCIDLQHPPGERPDPENANIIRVGADIHHWLPPRQHEIVFAAFFPPCTDLAVSGARWMRDKGIGKLHQAVGLFFRSQQMAELLRCAYLIENPVSTISTYWREPDYTFHPNEYGDPYLKRTCLWVGGGFVMPTKAPVKPTEGMKLYWLPPSKERANLRSQTPPGFAEAVFKANDPAARVFEQQKRLGIWRRSPQSKADKCALTGLQVPGLVRRTRVAPSLPKTTRSLFQGIPLATHIDALYQRGLIAFSPDGKTMLSSRLPHRQRSILDLPSTLSRPLSRIERASARFQRENVFLRFL